MTSPLNRRDVLRASTTVAVGALAGCSNPFGSNIEFDDDVPDAVAEHLSGANNVDGSITDLTGQSAVTIDVGPNGAFAYGPALARVDTGTTVTWEWQTSGHTVTSESTPGDSFDSGLSNTGSTFEQTLEQPGSVLYICEPHRSQGHRGALIVGSQ